MHTREIEGLFLYNLGWSFQTCSGGRSIRNSHTDSSKANLETNNSGLPRHTQTIYMTIYLYNHNISSSSRQWLNSNTIHVQRRGVLIHVQRCPGQKFVSKIVIHNHSGSGLELVYIRCTRYLLVLFSASTNIGFTGPYVTNSVWDYVYLFEVLAGFVLQDQYTGAQVFALVIDFITRVFLIKSLLAVSASGGTLYNFLSNLRMTGLKLSNTIIPTILMITNPICVVIGVIFWERRFSYLDEVTSLKHLGESFEVTSFDELSKLTHDQKSFAAAVLAKDVDWVSDAVYGHKIDPKKLNLVMSSKASTRAG